MFGSSKKAPQLLFFSVFDAAAGAYSPPQLYPTEAVAVRSFKNAANGGDRTISGVPADFSLVRLGSFDPSSGEIVGEKPERIIVASQLIDVPGNGIPSASR